MPVIMMALDVPLRGWIYARRRRSGTRRHFFREIVALQFALLQDIVINLIELP